MSFIHFVESDQEFGLGFAHGQKAYWANEPSCLMDAGYALSYYEGYDVGWWNENAIEMEEGVAGIESEALGD